MRGRVPPKLDDRSFEQLRQEAIQQLHAACPGWTDFSPSDPGIALVEAFAYLTQVMLYRLNRVPDKQYNAFLRLIGITPLPPAAATTTLVFERSGAGADRITIPAGTRAAAGAVQFTTVRAVRLEGTAKQVEVPAFHGEVIENELVGKGSGAAGLEVRVGKPPVVAPMSDGLDLVVAVEETEAIPAEARAVTIGTKTFRVWSEVANFANLRGEDHVFTVDRRAGIIRFGPAAEISDERGELRQGATPLGSVPPQNREIRVSYRTGGGAGGNVAAGSITTLRDAIPGVTVTNPTPGTGGRDEESFDNALIRGPTDFHRLERAVTARDVETLARRSSGVARAKAFTKSEFWKYAKPGIIEVRLVPTLGSDASALRPAVGELRPQATDELEKVLAALDNARPLGSSGEVGWTNLKTVSVKLEVVVSRQEDRIALERRVSDRLYKLITPLPRSAWDDGWPYGRALRRYDVEGAIRAEPGVLYTNRVELVADEMPEGQITSIAIDEHQPRTWYAGCGPTLYRTVNGGDGWEAMHDFTTGDGSADEVVSLVRGSRKYPGRIAAVTRFTDINHALVTKLYHSEDCGETWTFVNRSSFRVRDLAWADRNGVPLLYLATDGGLWEVLLNAAAGPVQVPVTNKADQGFTAVATHEDVRGVLYVAVAATDLGGVYLSRSGGAYVQVGLSGRDVGELAIQRENVRAFLWAGLTIPGTGAVIGGALRYELLPDAPAEGWVEFQDGWEGGSLLALGFAPDGTVLAGTHSKGVAWLPPGTKRRWSVPKDDVGVPVRDEQVAGTGERNRDLHPISSLGVDATGAIAAGTIRGVYRALEPSGRYVAVTFRGEFPPELREFITLPPTWLFRSGEHVVTVKSEDEVTEPGEGGPA
ncbi:MAG TPA: putative baseplate assembly protein [Gemmatimonadales bacterium]|nr:putative baseplate assembly protein [Gemmatimonadales bacterium]